MATSFEPIKFANLTEKTTAPSDADIIVIEDSTATKKAKWSNLISWIKSKLNIGSADISSIGDGTVTGAINMLNTNLHPQWNQVNSVSGSNVAGDTLQLTSSQNGWCVVSGFKYWDIAIIYVNNISLILEQNVGDSDAKTSFTHIFPVKKNDTVKITYPANPQKREFSIRLYS